MNPHANARISPLSPVISLLRHRGLVAMMVRRDIASRYKGSYLGWIWELFNPALMLAVYTFLFAGIFGARWAGVGDSKLHFGVILFAGLLVHGCFADLVNRSSGLVVSHANYVKRVIFPLEILSVVALGTAIFHVAIGFGVLLLALLALGQPIHAAVITIPLILLPLFLLALGVSWTLASIGVFVRDVGQFVALLTTALMFVSPIFYPLSAVPSAWQAAFRLNPLVFFIEQVRAAVIWGVWPEWPLLVAWFVGALLVAWAGHAWFQLTRKGFADVL